MPPFDHRDRALMERIKLIEMRHEIPRRDRQALFVEKLVRELPGILNWALEGLRRFVANGMMTTLPPLDTAFHMQALAEDLDSVRSFVSERCDIGEDAWVGPEALYTNYLDYCVWSGRAVLSSRPFVEQLQFLGYEKRSRRLPGVETPRWVWAGLTIKAEDIHHA